MKLQYITITGADDNTEISEIIALSKRFPLAEWGILFSPKRIGEARYPSLNKAVAMGDYCTQYGIPFSLHLCGGITRELMMGNTSPANEIIARVASQKSKFRIQINFNAYYNTYKLNLFDYWAESVNMLYGAKIIHQLNKSNATMCNEIIALKRDYYNFLYDASGGRGTEIQSVQPPIPNHLTGYAGGLTPENIAENLGLIGQVANTMPITIGNETPVWIDTETGVRTNNVLDMHKVKAFLETASLINNY